MGISATLMGISAGSYNVIYQAISTGKIDVVKVLEDAAAGAIMGALAGGAFVAAGAIGSVAGTEIYSALACIVSPANLVAAMISAGAVRAVGGFARGLMDLDAHNAQIGFMLDSMEME